ncbi:Gfo/Idh/MocA family protein [Nitrosopumilus sp. S6]
MRFLVIGCGSIGQRHIKNLKKISKKFEIFVFDNNKILEKNIVKEYKVFSIKENSMYSDFFDCILVCTPPNTHMNISTKIMKKNSNIFIEKPLSNNLNGIEKLIEKNKKTNSKIFVGYMFRFNKGIKKIKSIIESKKYGNALHVSAYFGQYLPDWRPNQNYVKNYTAWQKQGGGIIFDGSHEIDYLTWIFGNPLKIQSEYVKTKFIKSDAEAICDVILRFKNNVLGTIHIDFVRRKYKRTLEILCEKAVIRWSLSSNKIEIFIPNKAKETVIKLEEDVNDMYLNELKHVISCINNKKKSDIIDIENGINILKSSKKIKENKI